MALHKHHTVKRLTAFEAKKSEPFEHSVATPQRRLGNYHTVFDVVTFSAFW